MDELFDLHSQPTLPMDLPRDPRLSYVPPTHAPAVESNGHGIGQHDHAPSIVSAPPITSSLPRSSLGPSAPSTLADDHATQTIAAKPYDLDTTKDPVVPTEGSGKGRNKGKVQAGSLWTLALWDEAPSRLEGQAEDDGAASGPSYRLKSRVGEGGMGEVWEARQVSLDRQVAVKRIKTDNLDSVALSQRLRQFRQEAVIGAQLEHPHIVPIHDLGVDHHGHPLMAMKLVRGLRWHDVLAVDWEQMEAPALLAKHLPILVSVTQAVAFAHARGVIHRDLKPSQVMVGEYGEVMLMDWGLAMVHDPNALAGFEAGLEAGRLLHDLPTHDSASSPCGTLVFMAPEQTLPKAAKIGPWTDVYLLGGILYFIMTGHYPHEADSPESTFHKAAFERVEPPNHVAPERAMPPALVALTMRAMERDIGKRLATAKEFLTELEEHLSGSKRAQESNDLTKAVGESIRRVEPSYAKLSPLVALLDKARGLWPDNPALPGLWNEANARLCTVAIGAGDLTLARHHAQSLSDDARRDQALELVEVAVEQAAAVASQRKAAVRLAVAAVLALLVGLTSFLIVLSNRNTSLAEETNRAREATNLAEQRARQSERLRNSALFSADKSQELAQYMVEELRMKLDLTVERDRSIRDAVGKRVLEFTRELPKQLESDELVRSHAQGLANLSETFADLALLDEALEMASESLRLRTELLGKDHPELASSVYAVAEIKCKRADQDADVWLQRSLDLYQLSDNKDAPIHVGVIRNDLASLKIGKGQYAEAEKIFLAAIEDGERREGGRNRNLAMSYNNLGYLYSAMGRNNEAIQASLTALELLKSLGDLEPSDESMLNNNIGLMLVQEGQSERAEKYLRSALLIDQQYMGPDHPDTAIAWNNLGMCMDGLGRKEEALECYTTALKIDTKALGPYHPLVGIRINNLAVTLEEMDRPDDAVPMYREALLISEKNNPTRTPDLVLSIGNLALALARRGVAEESRALIDRATVMAGAGIDPTGRVMNYLLTQARKSEAALADRGFTPRLVPKSDGRVPVELASIPDPEPKPIEDQTGE